LIFNFRKHYIELGGKYTSLRDMPASYNWFVGPKAPKSIDAGVIEKEEVFRISAVKVSVLTCHHYERTSQRAVARSGQESARKFG
jgi:hypothetical protein